MATKGFTLIELMITVVIIGILASIAYPSYNYAVRKSRRADAKAALMSFSNAIERRFVETNTYKGNAGTESNPTDTGTPYIFPTQSPIDGGTAYYTLTIQSAKSYSYTLRATPIGVQDGDGYLEINHLGQRFWDKNNDNDTSDDGETAWD